MEKITIDWSNDMLFTTTVNNFEIKLDAAPEHGGSDSGTRPKPLMLVALAGCTGMDVASLARKMRVEMRSLAIDVLSEKSEGMPVVYTSFEVIYRFEAEEADRDKIIKMVVNSQERYCGVSAMMAKIAPVTYKIFLNGAQIK